MTDDTIRRLRRWFLAYDAANENTVLLCGTVGKSREESDRVSRLCADRMAECAAAQELFELNGHDVERPLLLDQFFAAERDKGCGHCWVMSGRPVLHPECEVKIRRWFACREALMAFVKEMYVPNTIRRNGSPT